jgi:hypothetical protein
MPRAVGTNTVLPHAKPARCRPRTRVASIAVALVAAMFSSSASASGPQKGPLVTDLTISCSVTLSRFPSPMKSTNPTNCLGLSAGLVVGLQGSQPGGLVVGIADAIPLNATVQYSEPCVAGSTLGFANGVVLTGLLNMHWVDKVPRAEANIRIGTYTTPYTWTRVGATALITTGKSNTVVDPKKGSQSVLTWGSRFARDAVGAIGIGVFTPLGFPDSRCPGGPLTVQIVGHVVGA